jgi:uncharacterized membrane protein YhhN
MVYWWLLIPFLLAVLDWVAIYRNWKMIHSFAKQSVMIALIAWSWFVTGWQGTLLWFGLALVFSLFGDFFLLFKEYFIPGLVAFLLAHLAYLVGFNLNTSLLSAGTIGILLGTAAAVALAYPPIRASLNKKPELRQLKIPVLVYSIVLSLMMLSAIATLFRAEWSVWTSVLMAAGGILFFISDNYLARDRFVYPIANGQLKVMITYHLGQIALITGAVIHFMK